MATARVSSAEVKEVIQTDLTDLTPFIRGANQIISDRLSGQNLSEDTLKEVERWLAAHLLASTNRDNSTHNIKESKTGDAWEKYTENTSSTGIGSTPYGEMAKMLDPSNLLSVAGKRTARITTIDYADAVQS